MAWPTGERHRVTSWPIYWARLENAYEYYRIANQYWAGGDVQHGATYQTLANILMTSCSSWVARQISEPSVMSDDAILNAWARAIIVDRASPSEITP